MSLIRFENVSKSFAGAPVLDSVSLRIEVGEKVGLIGRNGTGKTTIFRLATGEVLPESGVVDRMRKVRMAHLTQLPEFDPATTIFDVALRPFASLVALEAELAVLEHQMAEGDEDVLDRYSTLQDEFAIHGGYTFRAEARRVLQGLGFGPDDLDMPASALSGGQTTRLLLALMLLEDADLLLLDEPENHLDIEAREWLEDYLKTCPRAAIIISHDRQMLNAVADRIIEVERGELWGHTGNYDAFHAQKALVREQQQKAFERQREYIRKEEVFIERFRYTATKARQVQSRVKRLDKLDLVDAPPPESADTRFSFGEVVRTGEVVLDATRLGMAYGDLRLYKDFSFQVHRGERIGIIGPNGSGKTTLLRQIAGQLEGASGTVRIGHKVILGYYEQKHESLNPVNDILREIATVRPGWTPEQIRTFMGRLLFTGEDVFKPISALSGGERSRVAVAKLILTEANLLLLDEPTNHLDIASREALEASLADFPGALLVVSHDRALIDRLVDRLIIVEKGHAEIHLGNYADYRWRQTQLAQERAAQAAAANAATARPKKSRSDRAAEYEMRKRRKQIEELEAAVAAAETRRQELETLLVEAATTTDYQHAHALKDEYDALEQSLADLYAQWEAIAEDK